MSKEYYSAIYYFFWKFRTLGANVRLNHEHIFFKFLEQQQHTMNWVWFCVGLFSILIISLSGLILSHKVAGPLFKLHTHMKSVAQGETLQNISFRERDYFLEVAQAYNEQLKKLSQKNTE